MREAPAAGKWLAAAGLLPDRAVVSDAVRALQSWELISTAWDEAPDPVVEPRVFGASSEDLLGLLRETPSGDHTVAVVGHNPGIERLAMLLEDGAGATQDRVRLRTKFPTGAIAVLAPTVAEWSDLAEATCRLTAYAIPR